MSKKGKFSQHQRKYACKRTSLLTKEMQSLESPDSFTMLGYMNYYKSLQSQTNKQKLLKNAADKQTKFKRSMKEVLGSETISKSIPAAITDVDYNYFRIIQARSKYQTKKINRNQYIRDINNCLRLNISTGYIYDEIFKIDEQFETEKMTLINIKDNFSKLSAHFEQYMDDDHKESMELIAVALQETSITEKKRDVLRKKEERLGKMINDIYNFKEIYDRTLSCTAFILSITPENFFEELTETPVRSSVKLSISSAQSLEDLNLELEEVKKFTPKLYFKDPWDVYQLLRNIEIENLKCMFHTLEFKQTIQKELDLINSIEQFSTMELWNIRLNIHHTEKAIEIIESRIKQLEDHCWKLLNEEYRNFISGNESIIMVAYFAETYAYLIDPEPHVSPLKNLSAFGREFMRLMLQADRIPIETFQRLQKYVTKTNKERKAEAIVSMRRLINFDTLINRTLKLLDLPEPRKGRKLMNRLLITRKPKIIPPDVPPISEEELLKLYLFTDMCRQQLPITEELEKEDE